MMQAVPNAYLFWWPWPYFKVTAAIEWSKWKLSFLLNLCSDCEFRFCMVVASVSKTMMYQGCFIVYHYGMHWLAWCQSGASCCKDFNTGVLTKRIWREVVVAKTLTLVFQLREHWQRSFKLCKVLTATEPITFMKVLMAFTDLLSRSQWIPKIVIIKMKIVFSLENIWSELCSTKFE